MSIQPGSSKLAGRHSVPEIQKKQKSQIKKILLQLLNYQGALSVGYHRQYSFYRRRLFTAYNIEILKEYLLGIVRDLLILPFDEASTMYVELNNLIKENRDCSLIGIPYLAFTNFQKQLINELQS